jgi:ribosome recycling factor
MPLSGDCFVALTIKRMELGGIIMAEADLNSLKQDLTRRMDGALETLRREFAGLRTGRAHPGLLEPVRIIAYGTEMPLNQVGTVGAPEPRMLTVQVWDKSMISAVEKAIRDSGLGLNPAADGMLIRVPIPQLTTERRNELVKLAHKYAEGGKISIRGVRRDGMEQIKGHEKKHDIGEDLAKNWAEEVQKLTDQFIKKVDEALTDKEKDIRQV